jgi:hypothetical protein
MKESATRPHAHAHFFSRTPGALFLPALLLSGYLLACENDANAEDTEALSDIDAATSGESDPVAASEPEPSEEPSEEPPREGPEGCYLEDSHVCDCDLDETECEGVGTWTAGCTSCTAHGPDAGESEVTDAGDSSGDGTWDSGVDAGTAQTAYGCYDPTTHVCSCDGDRASCTEAGGYWTDECTSCGSGEVVDGGVTKALAPNDSRALADSGESDAEGPVITDAATRDGGVDAGAVNPGCYAPVTHLCDCVGDEASCTDAGGYWTGECGCP